MPITYSRDSLSSPPSKLKDDSAPHGKDPVETRNQTTLEGGGAGNCTQPWREGWRGERPHTMETNFEVVWLLISRLDRVHVVESNIKVESTKPCGKHSVPHDASVSRQRYHTNIEGGMMNKSPNGLRGTV